MEKTVVKFTKPFGAYAKGDRAGFDADAAQHLQDLGVAKPDAEPEAEQGEHESAEGSNADGLDEQQPKPAGKVPKGAKA